jgi:type IV pilus assembly protein PilV
MIRDRGYSLLEVLVALVVISIGLLGVAAMQAAALSGTHTSQTESLVAIQAQSLADAMLSNAAFWAGTSAPASVSVAPAGSSVTVTGDDTLAGTATCVDTVCTAPSLAAYDFQTWAQNYFEAVPNATLATVKCNMPTAGPEICTIQLEWTQKASTAINGAGAGPAAATTASYTLINQF